MANIYVARIGLDSSGTVLILLREANAEREPQTPLLNIAHGICP